MNKYYKILGVNENSTKEEIKSAYRNLLKKFHPDTYNGDKNYASKKSAEINEAYAMVLADREKKGYREPPKKEKKSEKQTFNKKKEPKTKTEVKAEKQVKTEKFKSEYKADITAEEKIQENKRKYELTTKEKKMKLLLDVSIVSLTLLTILLILLFALL